MKNLVIGMNGEFNSSLMLSDEIPSDSYLVGVDGGARHLEALNLTPDLLVGDLDSISPELLHKYREGRVEVLEFDRDKDETDLELAVKALSEKGFERVILLGAFGGRLDYTALHLLSLPKYFPETSPLEVLDGRARTYIFTKSSEMNFKRSHGETLSLILLNGDCRIKELTGVKWEIQDLELTVGSGKTMSNIITEDEARLQIGTLEGVLLVTQISSQD